MCAFCLYIIRLSGILVLGFSLRFPDFARWEVHVIICDLCDHALSLITNFLWLYVVLKSMVISNHIIVPISNYSKIKILTLSLSIFKNCHKARFLTLSLISACEALLFSQASRF